MLPAEYDIEVYQGDTFAFSFALFEAEEDEDPKDVSSSQFRMQVRKAPSSGVTLLERDSDDDTITFGDDNWVTIHADSDEMSFESGNWYYDIEQIDGSTVQTKFSGRFNVLAEVTR